MTWTWSSLRDGAKAASLAPLPLRLVLGAAFIAHGVKKLFDVDGVADAFAALGIPESWFFAPLVGVAELAGGLLILVGFATRWAAAVLGWIMVVAISVAHLGHGFFAQSGGVELPLVYLAGLLSLILLGGGRLSVDATVPRLEERTRELTHRIRLRFQG